MRRPSLAVVVLLLSAGLAAVLPAAHGAAASAQPAAGMRITDWLEANAGISVGKPQSKPAAVGIAAVGVSAASTEEAHGAKQPLCFLESVRCGDFAYFSDSILNSEYIRATGYYMSYFDCKQKHETHHDDDIIFGVGAQTDRRQTAAGSCFIDIYGTDSPVSTQAAASVTVGHAQMSCDVSDAERCGLEGCNGATITMGVGKAYAVRQAISFEGPGLPSVCPELPSSLRFQQAMEKKRLSFTPAAGGGGGGRVRTPPGAAAGAAAAKSSLLASTAGASAGNGTKPAAAAAVSTAQARVLQEGPFVCVGPAVVVSGAVTVTSRTGATPYSAGWVTYETFAYNKNGNAEYAGEPDEVQCGVPFGAVADLGFPVISPNSYSFELA